MFKKFLIFGLISLSIAATDLENEIDIEKLKSQLPDGILPEGFNSSAITLDNAKQTFKEKCQQAANNEEAYIQSENAAVVLKECLIGLVNYTILEKEIEDAQPNGELDSVFHKYCRKRTTAIECVKNFTVAIEPCLVEEEVASKEIFVNIFTNLLNFVCHKDGDQIALFIAEKGPPCFNQNKDALIKCINTTVYSYIPSGKPSLDKLPKLVMGAKQCHDMNTLQICVVKELETCEESTPANLVESMFKFVRNETPCANMTPPRSLQSVGPASHANTQTSLAIISTVVLTFTARIFL